MGARRKYLRLQRKSWSYIFTVWLFVQMKCFLKCPWSPRDPGCWSTHMEPCLSVSWGLCQGCTAVLLQPSAPQTHCCLPRDPPVSKPGEFKKMKSKFRVIHDRLGTLWQKSRLNYTVSVHPGLSNEDDSLTYTVELRFPYPVAHRNLTLIRYLLHRVSLSMT